MSRRLAALLAAALPSLCRAEPPSVVVEPDKAAVKTTGALSQRALVQKPTPIKGVLSWTVESRQHRGTVTASALSPDGKLLATGGIDGTIRLWDLATGKLVKALVGHDWYVGGLSFSPDGKYLASGGTHDVTLRVWDVATGQPTRLYRGMPAWVGPVSWSPDGRTIVSAGGTSGIVVSWDAATGQLKKKIELGRPIRAMAWHPTSREIALTSPGQPVSGWDPDTDKPGRMYGEVDADYYSVAYDKEGKTLAAGTLKDVRLFDADTAEFLRKLDGVGLAVAWEPAGKWVASLGGSKLTLWNPTTGTEVASTVGAGNHLHAGPDGKPVAVTAYQYTVFDGGTGKLLRTQPLGGSESAVWLPNRPLVSGVGTKTLALWDAATGKKLRDLTGHTAAIKAFAWSPDGKQIATASLDKTARVWDPATGEAKTTFTGHTAAVNAVAWGADGKQVLTGGADTKGHIWEAAGGKIVVTLPVHHREITAVAWGGPGGRTVATGGAESLIRLFTPAGKPVKELTDAEPAVLLAFSNDGNLLLSGPRNHVPRLWSVATGKVLLELPVGSPEHATGAASSPTGAAMAVGRANHTLQVVDLRGGKVLPTKFAALAPVEAVAWGPGGAFLAVACSDRCTRFFDPATGQARGVLVKEPDYVLAVDESGHVRAGSDDPAELVYVAQTDKGQETLRPAEFADKFKWKNLPANAKPTEK